MLNSQQLYFVNHYALVARRHGIQLPELNALLNDPERLRSCVEQGLLPGADDEVAEAAAKLAASMNWTKVPARAQSPQPRAPNASGQFMTPDELDRAKAALLAVAGPIADIVVEQIDLTRAPKSLAAFLDEAVALAQLDDEHRRALRTACGLSAD